MVSIIFGRPIRMQRIVFGAALSYTGQLRVIVCNKATYSKVTSWNIPSPKFDSVAETLTIHSMYTASKYSVAEIRSYTKGNKLS